ncbi:glutamate receptor ionotropic, kainate 5-like [Eurosta solidaginis]|uniref:glutamate receptor ionotropic, kainate 5-like n=1 Tax=Eurosta solidaginis TaxID=178769 RepID=UPI003531004E
MFGGFVLIIILRFSLHLTFASLNDMNIPQSACNSTIRPNVRVALWDVIVEHFVPSTSEFLISVHAKHIEAWMLMQDLLTCTLPYLNKSKIQIETYEAIRLPTNTRQFNLLLIDGVQALKELDPASLTSQFDFPEHYLVLLIDTDTTLVPDLLISSILSYFYRNYLVNVSLLFERKPNYVEVYTYFPFMANGPCKKNNVKLINIYNGSWHHPLATHIFPKKLANFQNCSLTIAVWDTPPYLSYYPEESGYARLGSFEGDMLVELAKKLNFTMNLVEPEHRTERGEQLPDGNLTGAMQLLYDHMADLSLGCFRYTAERCEILTAALPYYQTWQIFGVEITGQTYSSLEIFGFPFDLTTWICLLISFQLVLLLAYTIHSRCDYSPLARIIIGYPRTRTPITNTYSLFLGIPIEEPPRTNFARFVLCSWVIYGYLMRNSYQSCLYKLLQTDIFRTPPQNIFELIDQGYSLVMTKATYNSVKVAPLMRQDRIPIIFNNDTYEWKSYQLVERLGGKLAGVSPRDFLTYYIMSTRQRGGFYVLNDRFFAQYITIYFPKHSYLINRFNDLILQLRSQGMIDFWARKYLDVSYYKMVPPTNNDALDMEDLWGVFIAYFILIGLTMVVFLAELIWYQVTLWMVGWI